MPHYHPLPFDPEVDYELLEQAEQLAKQREIYLVGEQETRMIIGNKNGEPVAASWICSEHEAFSFDVAISKQAEGQGLGRMLVDDCLSAWHESKEWFPHAKLNIHVVNPKMITLLYQRGLIVKSPMDYPNGAIMTDHPAPGQHIINQAFQINAGVFDTSLKRSANLAGVELNDWIDTIHAWSKALPDAIEPYPDPTALSRFIDGLNIGEYHQDFLRECVSQHTGAPSYHLRHNASERSPNVPTIDPMDVGYAKPQPSPSEPTVKRPRI